MKQGKSNQCLSQLCFAAPSQSEIDSSPIGTNRKDNSKFCTFLKTHQLQSERHCEGYGAMSIYRLAVEVASS